MDTLTCTGVLLYGFPLFMNFAQEVDIKRIINRSLVLKSTQNILRNLDKFKNPQNSKSSIFILTNEDIQLVYVPQKNIGSDKLGIFNEWHIFERKQNIVYVNVAIMAL